MASKVIPWQTIQTSNLLGSGAFGDVYKGSWNGREVAVKMLHMKKLPDHLKRDFDNEIKILEQCQSDQIIQLFGACFEEGHYCMVMELMNKGSLYSVLHNETESLPWQPTRLQIAIDIGKGLAYLHDREILHRDMKSLNVLLDDHYRAKISDFGLSKLKLESKSTSTVTKQSAGTSRWKAPELFKMGVSHTKGADVYSYGVVLWEIASRKLPYSYSDDEQTVISWIKEGEQESLEADWPEIYSKVIKLSWSKERDKRPSARYIALELEKLLPDPAEKSWHFDRSIKIDKQKPYELVQATDKDIQKVIKFYSHCPVPGYEVASVKVICNPAFNRGFELHMNKLQGRHKNPAFEPKWSWDTEPEWRQKVHEMFEAMAHPHTDPEYPEVKLLPLWHGTRPEILDSICRVGFANLASTDAGFFGKGLYSAFEAEYAYRVYSKGALLLNWVAIFSAYPTVHGDMVKLAEKANFQNYDAHFIPVVPKNPANPHETNYFPTRPSQKHTYTEVVVFESAACLPRYLVELQATLTRTPQLPAGPQENIRKVETSSGDPLSTSNLLSPEEEFQNGLRHFIGVGGKKDFFIAFKAFQSAAEKGHADAEFHLGMSILFGSGCKIDNVMAVKYFKLAADQGHAIACMRLGRCYREGLGVKKDETVGDSYIQKAIEYKLIPSLQLKADQGDALAQCNLAVCYDKGIGVQKDPAMAVKYYKLAADQGDAMAQYALGWYYSTGTGIQKDEAMAVKYYKLSVDQGRADAQYNLGWCYENGTGVQKDEEMAVKYYKLAADQGYALAQCSLGVCYKNGKGVQKDETMAVKYYKLAADQGNAQAQYNLGARYANGKGVQKDEAMAVKYYKLAADQGHASAQYNLGVCYENGTGVKIDMAMALKYYQLAADQGNAMAQHNLGLCYDFGRGVQKDEAMAVKYYKLGADQGNAMAQFKLGWCYSIGTGVKKDMAMAVKYYKLAADQGYAPAQDKLGWCYSIGTGVKKDIAMAVKYYKLAADQGHVGAKAALTQLKS